MKRYRELKHPYVPSLLQREQYSTHTANPVIFAELAKLQESYKPHIVLALSLFFSKTLISSSSCCQSAAVTPAEAARLEDLRVGGQNTFLPLQPMFRDSTPHILAVRANTHCCIASCILLEVTKKKALKGIIPF